MRAVHSILGALLLACIFHVVEAEAASINIVALGASQTAGRGNGRHSGGVSPEQAFPAQLESMLRARGYDAQVTNAGVAGDTTDGMLARLDSSVPVGTKLVILQPGSNDGKHGASAGASVNVPQIIQKLKARGIKPTCEALRLMSVRMVSILQHTGKPSSRSACFPKLLVLLADASIASAHSTLS